VHICWDNCLFEMTGGQPTATAGPADLAAMARGAGFAQVRAVETPPAFSAALDEALAGPGPWFIHALVTGERAVRGPDSPSSPTAIRHRFEGGTAPFPATGSRYPAREDGKP